MSANGVTIASYLGPKTSDSLKTLCSANHIFFDENFMVDQNLAKDQFIQQVLGNPGTFGKIFQLKTLAHSAVRDVHDLKDISREVDAKAASEANIKINHEDHNWQRRFVFLVKTFAMRDLSEDAMAKFLHKEEMKARLRAWKEYIHKLSEADYERQLSIYEAERMKMEEMRYMMAMAEYDRLHQQAMNELDECFKRHDQLTNNIAQLKAQKQALIANHAQIVAVNLTNPNNVGPVLAAIFQAQHASNPQGLANFRQSVVTLNYGHAKRRAAIMEQMQAFRQEFYEKPQVGSSMLAKYNKEKDISREPQWIKFQQELNKIDSFHEKELIRLYEEEHKMGHVKDLPESDWKKMKDFVYKEDEPLNKKLIKIRKERVVHEKARALEKTKMINLDQRMENNLEKMEQYQKNIDNLRKELNLSGTDLTKHRRQHHEMRTKLRSRIELPETSLSTTLSQRQG